MADPILGAAQTFNLNADGNMSLNIPSDAEAIIVTVSGLGLSTSTELFNAINFANDASKEFTTIEQGFFNAGAYMEVESYILTDASADWPGTGAQTLYYTAPDGYVEGFNVVVWYVKNIDTANPIVGTDTDQGDTLSGSWASNIPSTGADDLHVIAIYKYQNTATVDAAGQTELVAPSIYNDAGLSIAYEQGVTSMDATFPGGCVPIAFTLRKKSGSTVCRYLFDEASSGTTPTQVADDTGNGNNLVITYSGDSNWTSIAAGNGMEFTNAAGQANGGKCARVLSAGNLDTSFVGATKLQAIVQVEVDDTHSFGCRVLDLGTGAGNPDFGMYQITTTFNVVWAYESGTGGVAKFPSLVGQGPTVVAVQVDTTQAVANDRVKVWYDGVAQTPTVATTVPQNETITLTTGTKYISIGSRYDDTRSLNGKVYYAEIDTVLLSEAQLQSASADIAANNDANWAAPVTITYDVYSDSDGSAILTGTCTQDHSSIDLYILDGAEADYYTTKVVSGKWKIVTNPFNVTPKVIRQSEDPAASQTNDSYCAYPQLYRLSNDNILVTYSVADTHVDNTQRCRGMLCTDQETFDVSTEFTIYDHPSNFATQGPGGGIDAVDNRPYFIFWYYDPALGGRDQRQIVRGDTDGTNFTYLKDVNTSLDWSDTNLVDGKPFYQYFGTFVTVGSRQFQLAYGRSRCWLLEWDQVGKDLINKQTVYDINATYADGSVAAMDNMGEPVMVDIDGSRVVFLIRDQPNLDSFAWCKGTIDASGNFTLDATGTPDNNIEAWTTTTVNAGCTIRSIRIGDDIFTAWGARLDVEDIITTRINKEDFWNDPGLAFRDNENNNRTVMYDMNPNAVGQGLDTGMPWILPYLDAAGNVEDYTALVAFYDQQSVGNNDEASVYYGTFPRLT